MEIRTIDDLVKVRFEDRSTQFDISAIVNLTVNDPYLIMYEDMSLSKLSSIILNHSSENQNSHITKLNMLIILAQLAKNATETSKSKLKLMLVGVSSWFDKYVNRLEVNEVGTTVDTSMHLAMLLLLARVFDYELKTEDMLELTNFNRVSALVVVLALIEEANSKENLYELPLLLQLCRFLRGFSIPNSYFSHLETTSDSLTAFNINEFSSVINSLLSVTMEHDLLEKLTCVLSRAIFGPCGHSQPVTSNDKGLSIKILGSEEHAALIAVNAFLQNLFLYGEGPSVVKYQQCILKDTSLVSKLLLPYLERCVLEARLCDPHMQRVSPSREGRESKQAEVSPVRGVVKSKAKSLLASGVTSSLRTLVMATFRSASSERMLPHFLNPINSLLRSAPMLLFKHPSVLALLCMINVNMNTMDSQASPQEEADQETILLSFKAHSLLKDIALAFENMSGSGKQVVLSFLESDKHGLPVSRDLRSYDALLAVLYEESVTLAVSPGRSTRRGAKEDSDDDDDDDYIGRAEAKSAVKDRLQRYKGVDATRRHRRAQEEEETPKVSEAKEKSGYRLLGDLPSLSPSTYQPFDLSLPLSAIQVSKAVPVALEKRPLSETPSELCCNINGHVMKDPVRSPTGLVFERSTIHLWLATRGSVCPCTGNPLRKEELVADPELRIQIMRWQIQKQNMANDEVDEDPYDF